MVKIAGFNHLSGTYEGHEYDNYMFVCYDKEANEKNKWSFEKVKAKILRDANLEAKDLINKNIEFSYDRDGVVRAIYIV